MTAIFNDREYQEMLTGQSTPFTGHGGFVYDETTAKQAFGPPDPFDEITKIRLELQESEEERKLKQIELMKDLTRERERMAEEIEMLQDTSPAIPGEDPREMMERLFEEYVTPKAPVTVEEAVKDIIDNGL